MCFVQSGFLAHTEHITPDMLVQKDIKRVLPSGEHVVWHGKTIHVRLFIYLTSHPFLYVFSFLFTLSVSPDYPWTSTTSKGGQFGKFLMSVCRVFMKIRYSRSLQSITVHQIINGYIVLHLLIIHYRYIVVDCWHSKVGVHDYLNFILYRFSSTWKSS